MELFVQTNAFKQLNVGFEGLATERATYRLYKAECKAYCVETTCRRDPGHGSLLNENTGAEKMKKIGNVFLNCRDQCVQKLKKIRVYLRVRPPCARQYPNQRGYDRVQNCFRLPSEARPGRQSSDPRIGEGDSCRGGIVLPAKTPSLVAFSMSFVVNL